MEMDTEKHHMDSFTRPPTVGPLPLHLVDDNMTIRYFIVY